MHHPASLPITLRTNHTLKEEHRLVIGTQPVDLTGYSAKMQARRFPGGPLVFELLTETNTNLQGIHFIERSQGVWAYQIDELTAANAHAAIAPSNAPNDPVIIVHDIKFTSPDGKNFVWMEGTITIKKGVTNG